MGIKVKISEAIKNEILRQEIAEGFHSLLLKNNVSLFEALLKQSKKQAFSSKNKEVDKELTPAERARERHKGAEKIKGKYEANLTEVLKMFHSKSNAEQKQIIRTTMEEFLSVFLSGNFLKIAVQQNLDNENLTILILEYGYGNNSNKIFNQIKEEIFDIYLNVIIAYFFQGKGKESQISGNRKIDNIILYALQKALIYDIKREQIPDWLLTVSTSIDKEIYSYFDQFDEDEEMLQEALIGPQTVVQAVFGFNRPTMEFIKQELRKGTDTRETRKYRGEDKAAVAVASAIVRRAAYAFKDFKTGDKVLDEILDLIATKLFKDNSSIKNTLISKITSEVTKKIDKLKSGKMLASRLLGSLASSGFK